MAKNRFNMFEMDPTKRQELETVIKSAASRDLATARQGQLNFVKAVETPLRKVLLSGNTINQIYVPVDYRNNVDTRYPLDLLTPGRERDYYAYTMPNHGLIQQRRIEGVYIMIPFYKVANAIDCELEFLRDANWPVLNRMLQIFEAGFVKKDSDDGWQTILGAAVDRNILVNDPDAGVGQFTPRLVTLMKTVMRRNGGGNSATMDRGRLTDLYVSPEAADDMRAWGLNLIPDAQRERIYVSPDGVLKIFDVTLHDMDEFGEGQEYQLYYTGTLGGAMAATDVEIVVGLDLQNPESSFVHPIRDDLATFNDDNLHRQGLFGMYGWQRGGWAVLDSRKVLLGSL